MKRPEFANKIGISNSQLGNYINNNSYPSIPTIVKICKLFDYKIDDFIKRKLEALEDNNYYHVKKQEKLDEGTLEMYERLIDSHNKTLEVHNQIIEEKNKQIELYKALLNKLEKDNDMLHVLMNQNNTLEKLQIVKMVEGEIEKYIGEKKNA